MESVSFIIPAYEEEETVGRVVSGIPREEFSRMGFSVEVLVVDDGSLDETSAAALSAGAKVLSHERNRGKGAAVRSAMDRISDGSGYVVLIDGDATYSPSEVPALLSRCAEGRFDAVFGARLGGVVSSGSMRVLNLLGNLALTFLVCVLYGRNVRDSCSGVAVWRRESLVRLLSESSSEDFTLEMDLLTRGIRRGMNFSYLPVSYGKRVGGASSLDPFADGLRIFFVLLRNRF